MERISSSANSRNGGAISRDLRLLLDSQDWRHHPGRVGTIGHRLKTLQWVALNYQLILNSPMMCWTCKFSWIGWFVDNTTLRINMFKTQNLSLHSIRLSICFHFHWLWQIQNQKQIQIEYQIVNLVIWRVGLSTLASHSFLKKPFKKRFYRNKKSFSLLNLFILPKWSAGC